MVQAEVAERIAAPPGRMSYLSVFVQFHAAVRVALRVPPEAFEPAPEGRLGGRRRWSRTLRPRARRGRASRRCGASSRPGFRERRKMLRNVLARQLRAGPDGATGPQLGQARVDAALAAAGIAGDRRPQTLSVEDWLRLLEAFE